MEGDERTGGGSGGWESESGGDGELTMVGSVPVAKRAGSRAYVAERFQYRRFILCSVITVWIIRQSIFLNIFPMNQPTSVPLSVPTPALPDRLSVDPRSPHHVAEVFQHDVGIRFNGKERADVDEYCVSEGWVKVPAGKTLDRKGRPLLITLKGSVEAFYK